MRPARLARLAGVAAVVAASAAAWAAEPPRTARTASEEAPPPGAPPAPAAEQAAGAAVEGTDMARLAVTPELAAALDGWSNAGYRVRRSGEGEVTVEVRLEPLRSEALFPPGRLPTPAGRAGDRGAGAPREGAPPGSAGSAGAAGEAAAGGPAAPSGTDVAALAAEITGGAETRYQAVSAVLGWLVRNVVAEGAAGTPPPAAGTVTTPLGSTAAKPARPGAPPAADSLSDAPGTLAEPGPRAAERSPAEVLARRAGDPAAVARLAVALLGSVGIEARVVRGLVAGAPDAAAGPRGGSHAWIEVTYPDRGGVFSDPLHSHHYVPATYLPLPGARDAGPPAGGSTEPAPVRPAVTLIERADRRLTVDVYPAGSPGITARKNRDRQEAGALRVVVAGDPRGSAVLAGRGTRRARELVRGESVFVGLAAGSYTLEVFLEGRPPTRREIVIAPRERSVVYLPEGRSAAAAPPLTGAAPPPASPRHAVPAGGRSAPRPRP